MKPYALSLLALCLLSGCASPIVRYEALSEKAAADLKTCVDAPPPDRMPEDATDLQMVGQRIAIVGPQLRQCQRAAEAALEQHERAKLRSDE